MGERLRVTEPGHLHPAAGCRMYRCSSPIQAAHHCCDSTSTSLCARHCSIFHCVRQGLGPFADLAAPPVPQAFFLQPHPIVSCKRTTAMPKRKSKSASRMDKPWEHEAPENKSAAKKHLSAAQKAEAKRRAKKAGRPYPNLVDNMHVARGH